MSLLGREEDKVYHVLIPPEYDCGMNPPFFFPEKAVKHELLSRGQPTGKRVSSTKIGIELFEVPFVRMRGWYQDKFKSELPSYKSLISKVQSVAPPAVVYPEIEIDAWGRGVLLNGVSVALSSSCFAMLLLLASGCHVEDLHSKLLSLHGIRGTAKCDWLASFQTGTRFKSEDCPEDVTKVQSELRKKLNEAGFLNADSLVPKRGAPVMFPLACIKWRNRKKFEDICGYLFSVKE
jgi:hypothetical protein